MTSTGKAARKRYGNRYDAKRHKARSKTIKKFGQLPVSEKRGNARGWREGAGPEVRPEPEQ